MSIRDLRLTDVLRLLAFAIIMAGVVVLQFDKGAEKNASLARLVPAGLGGFADARVAAAVLQSDPEEAQERVDALLRHRPMEAGHLSMFAVLAAEADDPQAGPALVSAAKRGWRDRYVQLNILANAAAQGQIDVAAARLDALARLKLDQEAVTLALSFLLQSEEGQQAVAARIIESDFLLTRFLAYAHDTQTVGPELVSTFAHASSLDTDLKCSHHGDFAYALLRSGAGEDVDEIWPARCRESEAGDFAFDKAYSDDVTQPYAWRVFRNAGISIVSGSEEGTLTLANRDPIRRPFARRYHDLEPGRYAIRVSASDPVRSTVGFSRADVHVAIHCVTPGANEDRRIFVSETVGSYAFEVPGDCPVQTTIASVTRGKAQDVRIELLDQAGDLPATATQDSAGPSEETPIAATAP